MNNNTFQLERFSSLVVRTLNQNKRIFIISALVFAGIPLLLFLFNMMMIEPTSFYHRDVLFRLLPYVTFIFSPFIFFYSINHPKKGLTEVMLPASILEKYINMMVFCMIIAPMSAIVLYGAMDSLIALIFPKYFNGYVITEFKTLFTDWRNLLYLNLYMQIIFFFNLLFSRHKILKTIGAYMIIGIAIIVFMVIGVTIAARNGLFVSGLEVISVNHRGMFEFNRNDNLLEVFFQLNQIFITILIPIGLMISSYFILKNKRY